MHVAKCPQVDQKARAGQDNPPGMPLWKTPGRIQNRFRRGPESKYCNLL